MSTTVKVLVILVVLVTLHFVIWNLRNDISDGERFTKKNIFKLIALIGISAAGIVATIIFVPNMLI